jgi:hypothetical protein
VVISAVKKWRKEEDPDAPPPKWMEALGGLSAIAVIEQGELSHTGNVLAYLFFLVAAQSLVLAPIIVSAVAPVQAAKLLDAIQGWLERNNRAIVIAASSIFGVWFLWKGIAGLIG